MVKLEAENGAVMYINPARTSSIVASAAAGLTIVVADRMNHTVKGTPDEVHAKLFPEAGPEFALASDVRRVLDYVVQIGTIYPVVLDPGVIAVARKALGRET